MLSGNCQAGQYAGIHYDKKKENTPVMISHWNAIIYLFKVNIRHKNI